ncbi:MAG: hypothetical protein IKA58_06580, partial [Clostridia bacterium]|nr:hypothetical protein [Clostridia bacterium]
EVGLKWGLDNAKKNKQPVYAYMFDRTPPGNRFKAFHACDLWYMFGCMEQSWRPFEKTDEMLAAQKTVEGAEALTINVAEVHELNGEPVFYLENVTQINDAVIDLMIAEGVLTEEMIEQAGGREVFKAIPPTKSVAIYGIVDGYLTMYTGTYYDDAHKQTLIDTMTILFANTEFLS